MSDAERVTFETNERPSRDEPRPPRRPARGGAPPGRAEVVQDPVRERAEADRGGEQHHHRDGHGTGEGRRGRRPR